MECWIGNVEYGLLGLNGWIWNAGFGGLGLKCWVWSVGFSRMSCVCFFTACPSPPGWWWLELLGLPPPPPPRPPPSYYKQTVNTHPVEVCWPLIWSFHIQYHLCLFPPMVVLLFLKFPPPPIKGRHGLTLSTKS